MRQITVWWTLVFFVARQTLAVAGPLDEAAAAGADANAVIRGTVTQPSASSVVPGYTATPPERAYYGQPGLVPQANVRLSDCVAATNDPVCEAQRGAAASANTPRPAVGFYDPSVAAARDIGRNPTTVLGDLSTYYTGCA